MKQAIKISLGLFIVIVKLFAYDPIEFSSSLQRIAFGSCNRQDLDQSYWEKVSRQKPELWLWLGDNIYGDSEDPAVLKQKYETLFLNQYYQKFRQETAIIGIWDDHDYGKNDGHSDFKIKAQSQQLCLDFLEVPLSSERRKREGVYVAYTYGRESEKIKFMMLDTRYHAEKPSRQADLLGESQWNWLERELKDTTIKLFVLCSSIQVLPLDHRFEKWANYPVSRERLLKLLNAENLKNVLLLSGDRHMHEISSLPRAGHDNALLEVTSSGLTHSWKSFSPEPNRYRQGELFHHKGFGVMEMDWKSVPQKLTIKVMGMDETQKLKAEMSLD